MVTESALALFYEIDENRLDAAFYQEKTCGEISAALLEHVKILCLEAVEFCSLSFRPTERIRRHVQILAMNKYDDWADLDAREGPVKYTKRSLYECIRLCERPEWRNAFFAASLTLSAAYADYHDNFLYMASEILGKNGKIIDEIGALSWHEYHRHWLNAHWEEIDPETTSFLLRHTHIVPVHCEFMPIGSSFYVFPEAKKK